MNVNIRPGIANHPQVFVNPAGQSFAPRVAPAGQALVTPTTQGLVPAVLILLGIGFFAYLLRPEDMK